MNVCNLLGVCTITSVPLRGTNEQSDAETTAEALPGRQSEMHDDAALRQAIVDWINDNRNKNTKKSYSSSFRLFVNWCKQQVPALPFDPPTDAVVARYAQHLVLDKDAAFGTVSTRLAAIADDGRYKVESTTNPLAPQPTRSVLVTQMMKCLRPMTKPTTKKLALSMDHLRQMAALLQQREHADNFVLQRDFFMVVLASVTLLRRSEVVRLEVTDVAVTRESIGGVIQRVMSVFVNKLAKNDVERKGHTRYVLEASGANRDICPVRLYFSYISKWRSTNKWLFYQKTNHAQLSSSTPNHGLKKLLKLIGLAQAEVDQYGFHSCRRGGATAAAERGIPIHLLKRHGNWRSDAVYEYIEDSLEQKIRVSSAMLHAELDTTQCSSSPQVPGAPQRQTIRLSEIVLRTAENTAAVGLRTAPEAGARRAEQQSVKRTQADPVPVALDVHRYKNEAVPISSLFRLQAPRSTGAPSQQKS
jgi:integrase